VRLLCFLTRRCGLVLLAIYSLLKSLLDPLFRKLRNAPIVLTKRQIVLQASPQLFVFGALLDIAQQSQDLQVSVGEHDVSTRVELKVEPVQPV
jgi:hypothetical protein